LDFAGNVLPRYLTIQHDGFGSTATTARMSFYQNLAALCFGIWANVTCWNRNETQSVLSFICDSGKALTLRYQVLIRSADGTILSRCNEFTGI
jgi:hypothetical protein